VFSQQLTSTQNIIQFNFLIKTFQIEALWEWYGVGGVGGETNKAFSIFLCNKPNNGSLIDVHVETNALQIFGALCGSSVRTWKRQTGVVFAVTWKQWKGQVVK
jgi:hypothetical protein